MFNLKEKFNLLRLFFRSHPALTSNIICFLFSILIQILYNVEICYCKPTIIENPHQVLSSIKRCISKECFDSIYLYNKSFGIGDVKNEYMLSYFNILKAKPGNFCYFPSAKQQIYGYPDILRFDCVSWPIKPFASWIELTNKSESASVGIKYPYYIGSKIDPKINRFIIHNSLIDVSQYILDIQVKPEQKLFVNNSNFDGVKYNAVTYEDFWKLLNSVGDNELAAKLEIQAYNTALYEDKIKKLISDKMIIEEAIGLKK